MPVMPAYRVLSTGQPPQWCDVEVPTPGTGEVLVRLGGAGLCGTDLDVIDHGSAVLPFRGPFTLGHENAGWVESIGPGVTDIAEGEPVVVSTIKSCGVCRSCVRGLDNYCVSMSSRGLREDGGLAPFMIADRRQLVSLGELHPLHAAPLADAGLSAFAAAASALSVMNGDARVGVIGVGGLGALAVQFVRALAPGSWIAAFDTHRGRVDGALSLGADAGLLVDKNMVVVDNREYAGHLTAVLDFVGTDATLEWAARVTYPPGAIVVCGRGDGVLPFSRKTVRAGVGIRSSRGGTVADLERVVKLAHDGLITLHVVTYPFREVERAYADLRSGRVNGRAVLGFANSADP